MNSRQGSIHLKLRPIRLAFLMKPSDRKALSRIIELNTILWGGVFNPIIPFYHRIPAVWSSDRFHRPSASEVVKGYLEAFDPDYVVDMRSNSSQVLPFPVNRVISVDNITEPLKESSSLCYGLNVLKVMGYLYETEFKFTRRHPLQVVLPEMKKPFALFKACCFGKYPEDTPVDFHKAYTNLLGAELTDAVPIELYQIHRNIYPLNLTAWEISSTFRWDTCEEPTFFYMDTRKTLDLIDYWNLRAAGWRVLPLPLQWAEHLRVNVRDIIERSYVPHRHNKEIMHKVTILKSRSTTEEELHAFVRSLDLPDKIIVQSWFPRIEYSWARDKDHVEPFELVADEEYIQIHNLGDYISFRNLAPKFADDFGGYGTPRWANTIEVRAYGQPESFAAVIPPSEGNLTPEIRMGPDIRIGRDGLVLLCNHPNSTHRLTVPLAEDVFFAWLKTQGWSAELSTNGRLVKQMMEQLGGLNGMWVFDSEEMLKLINKMSKGKCILVGEMSNRINNIASNKSFDSGSKRLEFLVEKNVFQVGVLLQCRYCARHSWYDLDTLSYELKCPKCLKKFPFPVSPPQSPWYYHTIGPFSLPNYADGAYCVLLALDFFLSKIEDGSATAVPSFEAKRSDDEELEADFGLLWRGTAWFDREIFPIFGECKTYNCFKREDFTRMRKIAKHFPGAALAFCTLRSELTNREKQAIRSIVNAGRKAWKNERPINPVVVLTKVELLSQERPPDCWKNAGGRFQKFAESCREPAFFRPTRFLQLCDATLQLHLDMVSWHQWLHDRWQRKQRINRQREDNQ